MPTMTEQLDAAKPYVSDLDRWTAVMRRDRNADGRFFYSVRTTGVYCRPTCAARLPRRENVSFHRTQSEAEQAGFRACKRCQPNQSVPGVARIHAVAKACKLIEQAEDAPALESLASAVALSPSHFHRVFKSLTGLTPKAYASAHRLRRVRQELSHSGSVISAVYNAGFKSTSRFYATSGTALGMRPKAFRTGGTDATIHFAVGQCSLGAILVAASELGICSIMLGDDPSALVKELQDAFTNAELIGGDEDFEHIVAKVVALVERPAIGLNLPLEVQGTAFQHRVWQKLCEIPCGKTASYSEIAKQLGEPKAARAVARACAANPVAVAIPCHRVVRTDGSLSGYRLGIERKAELLTRERRP